MLNLKTHNIIDYVTGVLLLFVPALFNFELIDAARNLFLLVGLLLIGYSLLTNYYYSVLKLIPLGAHMTLDAALGVIVILAPWVLGYRNLLSGGQELVHYVLGLAVIGLVALTRVRTEADKRSEDSSFSGRFSAHGRT